MTAEGSDVGGASDRGLTAEPASKAAPAMDGSGAATVSAEEHEMEGGMGDGGGGASKTGENGGIRGGGGSGPMGARDGGVGVGGGGGSAGGAGVAGAGAGGAGGGSGSGGASAGPSGGTASGGGGGGGNASAAPAPAPAPPPPPLLKGTLSYNVDLRRHMIRGMWNYENSTEFPPQRFELIRNLAPEEEVTTLPKDGEFHGSFSIAYHHTTAKGKKKERTMVVAESGVKITFTRIDKDGNKGNERDGGGGGGGSGEDGANSNSNNGDNSHRIYEVAGQGNNQFGVFTIKGKATGSAHEGDPTYNVELRKKYVTAPNAGAKTSGSSKKKSKGKKRKHPLSGAAAAQSSKHDDPHADPTSLPPPAKSYPNSVVCLRGKLTREKADVDIGAPGLESEIVHRIAGMWSSGLDLIEADPENARGLCNKFEYEHRCTVPTDAFPLSGRYAGWFYLTNEDGSRTRVAERDVTLKFRRNNAGYHNVDGKGSNAFGKYSITGTLDKNNVLTIFRHFQPRKIKKSTTPAPPPINNGGQGGTATQQAQAQQAQKQPEEPPGPPPIKLEEVVAPGDDKPDEPLQPISPPALGTYSAVSQGVLRINDDGSHTCTGKWAVTREHYNNGQTSNFHFGLEAHHAVQAADAMKKKKEGKGKGKGKDADDKDGSGEGDNTKDKPGQAGEPSTAAPTAISPFGPVTTTTFPVDSAQYKGSFKMRRGSTKYQSVVDRQIVLKFRKNKSGSYNIHGKGINSIGTFTLVGTLILSGRGSGHIELYRMYPIVPKPAPTPAPATAPPVPVWQGQGKVLPKPGGHHGGLHAKPGHIPQFPKPALAGTAEAATAIPDGPVAMAGGIVAGATQHPPAFPLAAMPHPTLQRRESSRQTKLPSRLEDDDPKAQLARLMEKCTVILKLIREQDLATGAFFAEPVDPVAHGIPTYHQVISNPMDLGTVSKRMGDGDIETPEEFAKLVRLVFENAIKFNIDTTHVVHQSAKHLLSLFNHKFRDVERMAEQMRKARKPTKAELKAAAREAKRKEKEAAREAKRKAKEERKRKVKAEESGPENEHATKRAKLEEVGAMAAANSKALAEMSAVASQGAAASSGVPGGGSVPRAEFNLLLDMVQQMQRQMVSMHSLLASTVEAAHASALTAGLEGAHAGAVATVGGASGNQLKAEPDLVGTHGHHDGQQDHQKAKKPPKKKAKAAPKPKPSPVPAPAPASPPTPAPAPAPAVEEEKPLTVTEQEVLTETINRLPADKLPTVIEIIRESASLNGDEDEIDLEIDQLDTATQRKLQRFVLKNVKPPRRKGKAIPKKAKPAPAPSPVAKPESSPPAPASPASPAKKEEEEEGEIEEDDEENDSAKNSSKQKGKSGSFFGFGDKDDSDSDTDSDSDNFSAGGSENKADKEDGDTAEDVKSRGAGGVGSDKKSPTRDSFHLGDDDNADGFGDNSMQDGDDDEDDDEGGGMANWGGMSKAAAPAAGADKGSDAEDEDGGNDEDDWGAALAYSASAKAKEAERKAREAKMQKDAEAARQKRLADAAAKGDEIRAQREEELAKEERLKEQKKKEEEEAIQKAREEQRKKTQSVKQTVDLDEERELMKQYEQGYLDMEEMGGGGSSPGSDFEF